MDYVLLKILHRWVLYCTTDNSSREEGASAKLLRPKQEPGMGHKINTGDMSTSKYQLLFPERQRSPVLKEIPCLKRNFHQSLDDVQRFWWYLKCDIQHFNFKQGGERTEVPIWINEKHCWVEQLENAKHWNLTNTVEKFNKSIASSSDQHQSVKSVVLANAKQWNFANTDENINKSFVTSELKRSGKWGVAVEWL